MVSGVDCRDVVHGQTVWCGPLGENGRVNLAAVRMIRGEDLATLAAINNDAVPKVNHLSVARLRELVDMAAVAVCAEVGESVAGMVLALRPGADYDSAYYQWFSARFSDFLYVDRIVVDARFRGQGIGAVLQDEVAARARMLGISRITCEVNLAPPNPGSMRFHQRLGFREVDQLRTGAKLVGLLEKVLPA